MHESRRADRKWDNIEKDAEIVLCEDNMDI